MSIDELICAERAIFLAEREKKAALRLCETRLCHMLDILSVLLLVLPMFGSASVPVFALTDIPLWEKISFLAVPAATALHGAGALMLPSGETTWQRRSICVSAALSVAGAILFIATRQPYPAIVYVAFLIAKSFALGRQAAP